MVALASNQEEADSILQAMDQGVHRSGLKEHWGALCFLARGLRKAYRDAGLGAAYKSGGLRKVYRPEGHARS